MFRPSPRTGSNLLRLLCPYSTFGRNISPNPVSNNLHRLRSSPAISFQTRALSISTPYLGAKASSKPGEHARVDSSMHVSQPPDEEIPSTRLVQRQKRTLSSFSLEGKTAVVTGGARGLGYVMAQALVESGANVAIVDLNGKLCNTYMIYTSIIPYRMGW